MELQRNLSSFEFLNFHLFPPSDLLTTAFPNTDPVFPCFSIARFLACFLQIPPISSLVTLLFILASIFSRSAHSAIAKCKTSFTILHSS